MHKILAQSKALLIAPGARRALVYFLFYPHQSRRIYHKPCKQSELYGIWVRGGEGEGRYFIWYNFCEVSENSCLINRLKSLEQDHSWRIMEISVTFLLEGILLLLVAVVGLIGNVVCFTTICRQKVQKLFHNLLLLLTTFDMVILDYWHRRCS